MKTEIFNKNKKYVCIETLDTKNILDNMNNLPCYSTKSFTDQNPGHIVTGNIRIVQSKILGKLLCKGPKYREPVSIDFSNCKMK